MESKKNRFLDKQLGKDYKYVIDNLKTALEQEKILNQQILGRLDIYQNIMDKILKLLIDKSTEKE